MKKQRYYCLPSCHPEYGLSRHGGRRPSRDKRMDERRLRKTEFDTVSGKRGFWLERSYRNTVGVPFRAVWMEGSGDKGWSPSDKAISADDGPLGSGATYRTVSVAGQKSVLEHHPVTGFSLSVKAGKKGTLTLESNIATEEEMISAAEILLTEILREDKAGGQK